MSQSLLFLDQSSQVPSQHVDSGLLLCKRLILNFMVKTLVLFHCWHFLPQRLQLYIHWIFSTQLWDFSHPFWSFLPPYLFCFIFLTSFHVYPLCLPLTVTVWSYLIIPLALCFSFLRRFIFCFHLSPDFSQLPFAILTLFVHFYSEFLHFWFIVQLLV